MVFKGTWETFRGTFFVVFVDLSTGGEFWTFAGEEGATKIEQVQRKEELWSFCDNNECPIPCLMAPWKGVYHWANQKSKVSSNVSISVQSQPDSFD